ncbi:hypothetical protein [Peribacillus simplex]|uniref:hypothetical protein n=1 Tax=Peribacillus simplex TaxID=1478 RepID=UPI003D2A8D08
MRPIILINNLIDQHENYTNCKDKKCPICTEIKKLSAPLNKDGEGKKIRQVLGKGEDITTGDVHYLIESGVRKMDIRKALGMDPVSFIEFLDDIGLKRKREGEEEMKISKAEYEGFKSKGKTDAEIAEEISVTGATIYNYKKKWYPDRVKTKLAKTKEYQETKKRVAAAISLDKNLEKALRSRITELEQQANGYPELVLQVGKLEEANIDLGNENSKLLLLDNKKSEEINQLKDAAADLEEEAADKDEKIKDLISELQVYLNEMADWKCKAFSYSADNEKMTEQFKDIRRTLESQEKEIGLYRALLKEVL